MLVKATTSLVVLTLLARVGTAAAQNQPEAAGQLQPERVRATSGVFCFS
jgi:hypothetical protein